MLFEQKIEELLDLVGLLRVYKRQKFDQIWEFNKKLYGDLDAELVKYAKQKALELEEYPSEQKGKLLSISQVKARVQKHLEEAGFTDWKIEFHPSLASRIMVARRGETLVVKLSSDAKIYDYELESILAHEIDVHARRYFEGLKS